MFEQVKDVLVNFKLSYLVDITIIALIIYQLYFLNQYLYYNSNTKFIQFIKSNW